MLPEPPVTFSTITAWPSAARSGSARMRATRSVGPPAAYGTTMVIGRDGKACARARPEAAGVAAAPAASCRKCLRGRFIMFYSALYEAFEVKHLFQAFSTSFLSFFVSVSLFDLDPVSSPRPTPGG